ncbi:ribosome recycling factor [Reinekea marina]|uniref:Ribosome-recycling factor n=1 Tax=Reinekea marina TaxID=1310421 RepID=A0ABV7WQT8_9GAMM|nr:ribosome recycling factor [Reinekea marina]MBU2862414.1 ribosome recycling factor [Reinekea forsetii]MDN3649963.1 ribosome recycling factor [Reinekea marina]
MIEEIKQETNTHNQKAIGALDDAFNKIRTGRANPAILDNVMVDYYGTMTPVKQVANVVIEDNRTLSVVPWEQNMVPAIEKAIMKSDLGLNPATAGNNIRIAMPMLTEETRKDMIKVARAEAEKARVSVRNGRRDANSSIKELVKEKEMSEDEGKRSEEEIQKLTNAAIAEIDKHLQEKEAELMKV